MTDTTRETVERLIHAAPFADLNAGIPEMVEALTALLARAEAAEAQVAASSAAVLALLGEREALRAALFAVELARHSDEPHHWKQATDLTAAALAGSAAP